MAGRSIKAVSRVFKIGKSQAVRIPQELAFYDIPRQVEVARDGDALRIRPITPPEKLTDMAEVLAMFSPDFMADGRKFHEQSERDPDAGP